MQKTPKKVAIHYVFPSEDDFGGDYYAVRVLFDGKQVVEYGDHYHDKGEDKADGFIEGFFAALGKIVPKVTYDDVEDKSLA